MKRVGIVADNYKVDRFKSELGKNGFTSIETFPFSPSTTTIRFDVPEAKVKQVASICKRIELEFNRSN